MSSSPRVLRAPLLLAIRGAGPRIPGPAQWSNPVAEASGNAAALNDNYISPPTPTTSPHLWRQEAPSARTCALDTEANAVCFSESLQSLRSGVQAAAFLVGPQHIFSARSARWTLAGPAVLTKIDPFALTRTDPL